MTGSTIHDRPVTHGPAGYTDVLAFLSPAAQLARLLRALRRFGGQAALTKASLGELMSHTVSVATAPECLLPIR